MFKDFKAFVMRGNVIDLSVGIIIGGAFGKIVSSFVSDVLMPPIGLLVGNLDFSGLKLILREVGKDGKPVTLNYGLFLNNVVDFLIMAFAVFWMVHLMNKLKSQPAPANPTEKTCPQCQMTIPIKAIRCGHCTSTLS